MTKLLVETLAQYIDQPIESLIEFCRGLDFELVEDKEYSSWVALNRGLEISCENECVDTLYFFVESDVAQKNDNLAYPRITELGIGRENSRTDVREAYGDPDWESTILQMGGLGYHTGYWDKFRQPFGFVHFTYDVDMKSISLIVCGPEKVES